METVSRTTTLKTPTKQKDLVETVEHYKNLKADHVPSGIVQTLNLASTKRDTTERATIKTVKVQTADGKKSIIFNNLP